MRDDERYPIPANNPVPWENVDSASSLPQVSVAGYHASRRDKYLVHPYEAVGLHNTVSETGRRPHTSASEKSRRPKATILGLRKRVFWTMAAVITTMMIVGIVVGATIGSSTTSGNSGSDDSASMPAATSTPMAASDRQIGAATMNGTNSTSTNIQVVYQDLDSTDLLYRLVWNDTAGPEQRISDLDPSPQQKTPIAVTTTNTTADDGITTNIYYLSANISNSLLSNICQVTLQCSLGAESCTVSASTIISDGASEGVVSDSGISAVALPESSGIRVYYKNGAHAVRVLAGNGTPTSRWGDSRIGSQSYAGSGVSAHYNQNADELQVVLVNSDSLRLQEFVYSDAAGAGTKTASDVTSSAPSGWEPTAEFSTCFQPGLDEHHIYYVDSTGDIHGIFRADNQTDWTLTQPAGTGIPVGGIASVAWDDEVRLLYMTGSSPTLSMSVKTRDTSAQKGYVWLKVRAL